MSYGRLPTQAEPTAEHGLVFMAYNASIAEQFEMIQRWLAGGNSSGVCSAESDPFVGVPEAGRRRVFRFVHDDKVMRLDLGDQPIVKLEWGLYAFVPSIAALKGMKDIVAPPAAKKGPPDKADGDAAKNPPAPAPPPAPLDDLGAWQRLLEDGRHRATAWKFVRDNGGVLSTAYGTLVGSPEAVLDVLKDDGGSFSASGYGERMEKSISQVDGKKGRGYLGQDDVSPHAGHQLPYVEEVNAAIERAVSEQDAFDAAHRFATGGLQRLQAAALAGAGPSRRTSVDITVLMGGVVAALCHLWFGLPDEKLVMTGPRSDDPNAPAQCPGHLIAVSRYIFSPHPSAVVEGTAIPQGISFAEAVRKFLQAGAPSGAAITKAILDAMPEDSAADAKVRTVAGVMLGFPPTVLGNLLTVLMDWTDTHRLWDMQQELTALRSAGDPLDHAHVQARLREPLLETMAKAPVPYMDWRTAAKDGNLAGCPVTSGKRVVVGLGSAVQVDNASRMLMFGGSRRAGQNDKTIHACPGYHLAVGVMLGCITALLTAGELRPTPNPRVLTLIG